MNDMPWLEELQKGAVACAQRVGWRTVFHLVAQRFENPPNNASSSDGFGPEIGRAVEVHGWPATLIALAQVVPTTVAEAAFTSPEHPDVAVNSQEYARTFRIRDGLYPHWQCRHHGPFDARVEVGCPRCLIELRTTFDQIRRVLR